MLGYCDIAGVAGCLVLSPVGIVADHVVQATRLPLRVLEWVCLGWTFGLRGSVLARSHAVVDCSLACVGLGDDPPPRHSARCWIVVWWTDSGAAIDVLHHNA